MAGRVNKAEVAITEWVHLNIARDRMGADYQRSAGVAESIIDKAIRLGHVRTIGTVFWRSLWTVTPTGYPAEQFSNMATTGTRDPIDPKWLAHGTLLVDNNRLYNGLGFAVIINMQVDWGQLVKYVERFCGLPKMMGQLSTRPTGLIAPEKTKAKRGRKVGDGVRYTAEWVPRMHRMRHRKGEAALSREAAANALVDEFRRTTATTAKATSVIRGLLNAYAKVHGPGDATRDG
jgi:hypothetical protein